MDMENIKVLDEDDNVVLLRRISVKGQHLISSHELESKSIDPRKIAKKIISQKMAEEMEKHILFTERIMPDGSILIEAGTYFYGL